MRHVICSMILVMSLLIFLACSAEQKTPDPAMGNASSAGNTGPQTRPSVPVVDNRGLDAKEMAAQMSNSAENAARYHTEQLRADMTQYFHDVLEYLKEEDQKRWPADNRRK